MSGRAPAKAARRTYLIQPLRDRLQIQRLLEPQRIYTAYALSQLEPGLFARSEWWLAEGEEGKALVMHSRGGLGNALVTLGDADALRAVLSLHPGPTYAFATFQVEHLTVMRRFFLLTQDQSMLRMEVTPESFIPTPSAEEDSKEGVQVRRLSGDDTSAINRLCSSEGGRMHYRSSHIGEGVYFGVYYEQRLVAVAGTHAVSPQNGIAVLGNVFTHPLYRNRHFAVLASSAVTETLLKTCPQVVLTVDPGNAAAVGAYSRLGYREECQLIEGGVSRKDMLGLGSFLRRLLARRRGRPYGRELVMATKATRTDNPTSKETTDRND
jgi:RimJ/RimL family protein N-acetyltransferase